MPTDKIHIRYLESSRREAFIYNDKQSADSRKKGRDVHKDLWSGVPTAFPTGVCVRVIGGRSTIDRAYLLTTGRAFLSSLYTVS